MIFISKQFQLSPTSTVYENRISNQTYYFEATLESVLPESDPKVNIND